MRKKIIIFSIFLLFLITGCSNNYEDSKRDENFTHQESTNNAKPTATTTTTTTTITIPTTTAKQTTTKPTTTAKRQAITTIPTTSAITTTTTTTATTTKQTTTTTTTTTTRERKIKKINLTVNNWNNFIKKTEKPDEYWGTGPFNSTTFFSITDRILFDKKYDMPELNNNNDCGKPIDYEMKFNCYKETITINWADHTYTFNGDKEFVREENRIGSFILNDSGRYFGLGYSQISTMHYSDEQITNENKFYCQLEDIIRIEGTLCSYEE